MSSTKNAVFGLAFQQQLRKDVVADLLTEPDGTAGRTLYVGNKHRYATYAIRCVNALSAGKIAIPASFDSLDGAACRTIHAYVARKMTDRAAAARRDITRAEKALDLLALPISADAELLLD